MVIRLALNVNVVTRIESILDTKCNEFRLFAVIYLDLYYIKNQQDATLAVLFISN